MHILIVSYFRNYGIKWEHEDMSVDMLDYLIDDNNIDIERDDIRFV